MRSEDEQRAFAPKIPSEEDLLRAVPRGSSRGEFKVGAFVLVGLGALLVTLFLLTDPSTFRGRYRLVATVQEAGGIRRGDPVQMKGVNIGRVLDFALVPEGVALTLELEGRWRVPDDSRVLLVSSGILGGRTVEVIPGRSDRPLSPGGKLSGELVEGILDFPPELGREARRVLEGLQGLLAEPTVTSVRTSVQEVQNLLVQLNRLVESQGEEVSRLTGSLNRSSAALETTLGSGGDLARVLVQVDSTFAILARTGHRLESAADRLDRILRRVEEGEGTLGQLASNPELYRSVLGAAQSLQALAEDIRANPRRYVRLQIF